jgi:hypothetical protein
MVASMTSHPYTDGTAKPPRNPASSYMNLPTFPPMKSWMSTGSLDIWLTTLLVLVC